MTKVLRKNSDFQTKMKNWIKKFQKFVSKAKLMFCF